LWAKTAITVLAPDNSISRNRNDVANAARHIPRGTLAEKLATRLCIARKQTVAKNGITAIPTAMPAKENRNDVESMGVVFMMSIAASEDRTQCA
jgi:hypothetical protein